MENTISLIIGVITGSIITYLTISFNKFIKNNINERITLNKAKQNEIELVNLLEDVVKFKTDIKGIKQTIIKYKNKWNHY